MSKCVPDTRFGYLRSHRKCTIPLRYQWQQQFSEQAVVDVFVFLLLNRGDCLPIYSCFSALFIYIFIYLFSYLFHAYNPVIRTGSPQGFSVTGSNLTQVKQNGQAIYTFAKSRSRSCKQYRLKDLSNLRRNCDLECRSISSD